MRPSTVPEGASPHVEGRSAETGREAVAALGHSVGIQYAVVAVMLGIGVFILWLLRAGHSIKGLSARAALSLTGYLRTRPDPWLEGTLRAAFAEFDRELALILQERRYAAPTAREQVPQDPGAPPGR
jgi:hypothetical protein